MTITVYWEPITSCVPPHKLFEGGANGSFSLVFREGGRIDVNRASEWTPKTLFMTSLGGSLSLEGQPIRCTGFAPGVTLRIATTRQLASSLQGGSAERFIEQAWHEFAPLFETWQTTPHSPPGVEIEAIGVTAFFARHTECEPRPGVMQINVLD